ALGAAEAIEEEFVDGARPDALGGERPPAGGAAVARVEEHDDALGLDALEDRPDLLHRQRRRIEIVGVGVDGHQVLREAVALVTARSACRCTSWPFRLTATSSMPLAAVTAAATTVAESSTRDRSAGERSTITGPVFWGFERRNSMRRSRLSNGSRNWPRR